MAIFDFLNNIPASSWVRGTMSTIDYYKSQINGRVLNHPIFATKLPVVSDVKFGSWYMGKHTAAGTANQERAQTYFVENIPTNVPSRYVRTSSAGGLYRENNFNTYAAELNGRKVVAYLEIVPLTQLKTDARATNYEWCEMENFFGSFVTKHMSDTEAGGTNTLGWGYGSSFKPCAPLTDDSRDNWNVHIKPYTRSLDDWYTVKSIQYYAVDADGNRERLQYYMPTMPMLVSGKIMAEDIMTFLSDTPPATWKTLTSNEPYGLIQLCLPQDGVTSGGLAYPFRLQETTATQVGNRGLHSFPFYNNSAPNWLFSFYNLTSENELDCTPTRALDATTRILYTISGMRFSFPWSDNMYMFGLFNPNITRTALYRFSLGQTALYSADVNPEYVVGASPDKNAFFKIFEDWGIYCSDNLDEILYGEIPDIVPENPAGGDSGYDPDLPTTGSGGDNETIDEIPQNPDNIIDDFPVDTPNITAINLCNCYIYNFANVRALFNWFCSKGYIENQSELFADKLSAINGLMLFPFDFVNHDSGHVRASSTTTIVSVSEQIGGYELLDGYNTVISGGELTYLSYFGNFMDWTHCRYSLYVPYGGVVELPANAVVNRRLTVQYSVDLLTGQATAIVKSYSLNSDNLGILVKCIPCQIGHLIPVQSNNYAQREISNTMSAIAMTSNVINTAAGVATGGIGDGGLTGGGVMTLLHGVETGVQQMAQREFSQQLTYTATGGISPATGLSLPQTPFLSISRKRPVNPSKFREMNGLPTAYYTILGDVSTGDNFVQCLNVFLDIPSAMENELNEIRSILANGVYI